jgi:hypothetical protein
MSNLKSKVLLALILALSAPTMSECTATLTCPTCTITGATTV